MCPTHQDSHAWRVFFDRAAFESAIEIQPGNLLTWTEELVHDD
jgi:hypothetical protein